jgi:HAE1 family hydrophobic/amphiphilic exporter-1
MNLAKISIKRPTFITAIIVAVLIVGFICMKRMSVDMFPNVNFPFVSVTTVYPGAGPRELETLVSRKLEEQISSIAGLKNVTSISQDGVSIVFGEFTLETDPKYAEQQVRDKVAFIRSDLPKDIDEPVIRRFDPADQPVMTISLKADLTAAELYDLADNAVKSGLEQVSNVSSVEIIGGAKREVHVDLDRNKLKDYESSVTMVSGRIASNSQNVPVGKVARGTMELSFRSMGEFRTIQEIKNVVVSFFGSDVPITIDKVGTVVDSTQDEKTRGLFNGKSALVLNVYKQSGANTVAVADELTKRIEKVNAALKGMKGAPKLAMVRDGARAIRMNIEDVKVTIFEGILLAILVVYLFLGNIRSTFITVVALPNSLVGAFIFMFVAGFSVNMLTLMALSLAVGLLIDDAIVVRENIFRHMELGETPMVAAQKGTQEVQLAVIATTLTVIAVFLPVGFLQGIIGQFFKEFGLTVVFAMVISLFDALTTAPMLSAYLITSAHNKEYKGFSRLIHLPAQWFEVFYKGVERFYERVIHFTLRHKILILSGSFLIFLGSLALVSKIPKTFMGTNEWGEFVVNLEAAPGTSLDQMTTYTEQIDKLIRNEKDVEVVMSTIGNTTGESNVAQLFVRMVPANQRKRSTSDLKEYLRKKVAPYKDTMNPTVGDLSIGGSNDAPFNLMLKGEDLEVLSKTADNLMPKLQTIPGLVDVDSNYKPGKPEFQVKFDPNRVIRLGVLSTMAGVELRGMVEGMTPAKYRENGLEYDIRVRLKEDQRDLSKEFDQLYVPNVNNQLVKLKNIAEPVSTTGPSKIYRRNRGRYVMITGNLTKNGAIGNITSAAEKLMAKEKLPDGVTYEFLGQSEDMRDLFRNMVIAAALSIIFIYMVLASLYESIVLPFTIMLALPLAIVGGLVALFISGQPLGMFTMIGFIMLLGLVTKNSILLVDYTQKLMRKGMSHDDALVKAGLTRLRPILMTTFALIAGMLPLALGLSEVGKFRMSMGIAIIGGLVSSTALTLLIIPAVFEYMDTFRLWMRKLVGRPPQREIDKDRDDSEVVS